MLESGGPPISRSHSSRGALNSQGEMRGHGGGLTGATEKGEIRTARKEEALYRRLLEERLGFGFEREKEKGGVL